MRQTIIAIAVIALSCMSSLAADKYTQKKEIKFDTADGWVKTGIILEQGQKVKVKAKGKWLPSVNNDLLITANGIDEERWVKFSIAPNIPHGRLIAYIDGTPNEYYRLGQSETFKSNSNGELIIGMNDKDKKNNKGTIEVTIKY